MKTSDIEALKTFTYNWDNKLRSVDSGGNTLVAVKYDPDGNRIFKASSEAGTRKYIVDIVGDLPVILTEIDPGDPANPADDTIAKTYIYANGQILAQHNGSVAQDNKYFYIHDRLGSVRQVIDTSGDVVKYYTYKPFGETLEEQGTLSNPFMFTGQYLDSEIDEYYLRARQYDPHISRFTSRDPVLGRFKEPMTLHVYLYCLNDPVNRTDLSGEVAIIGLFQTSAFRSAMRSAMWGAIGGALRNADRGLEGAAWGAAKGFAGGFAGGFIGHGISSFSSAGFISKIMGKEIAANIQMAGKFVGGGIGSAVQTAITDIGEEAFVSNMFSSVLIGTVYGGTAEPLANWLPGGVGIPKEWSKLTIETYQFLMNMAFQNMLDSETSENP